MPALAPHITIGLVGKLCELADLQLILTGLSRKGTDNIKKELKSTPPICSTKERAKLASGNGSLIDHKLPRSQNSISGPQPFLYLIRNSFLATWQRIEFSGVRIKPHHHDWGSDLNWQDII